MDISLHQFSDVFAHARGLNGWQQEYNQLDSGRYEGSTIDLVDTGVRIFRERANRAVAQHIQFPQDQHHFLIPLSDNKVAPFHRHSISLLPRCENFRAAVPSDYDVFVISIDDGVYHWLEPENHHLRRLNVDAANLSLIKKEWMALTDYLKNDNNELSETLRKSVQRKMKDGLALLFENESTSSIETDRSYFHTHRYIVDRCHQLIESYPQNPPSLMTLCQSLKISRRTLQYSFESETGQSPLNYLRALRLNAVRRRLHTQPEISVTSAAAEQGFFHQSYFTRSYRQLFDELPTETRKRAI